MKLIYRKNAKELMRMLVVTVPIERMVRAAAVKWNSNILKEQNYCILK